MTTDHRRYPAHAGVRPFPLTPIPLTPVSLTRVPLTLARPRGPHVHCPAAFGPGPGRWRGAAVGSRVGVRVGAGVGLDTDPQTDPPTGLTPQARAGVRHIRCAATDPLWGSTPGEEKRSGR
jgi:hypothetical protein